jgi:hypothetical protein
MLPPPPLPLNPAVQCANVTITRNWGQAGGSHNDGERGPSRTGEAGGPGGVVA